MPLTFTAIQTVTVGTGGQLNIEFASITGTYTDLAILMSPRGDAGNSVRSVTMRFNADPSNHSDRRLLGSGATVSSDSNVYGSGGIYCGEATSAGGTASTFSNILIYITNYAGSTNKAVSIDSVNENNATTAYQQIVAGAWSSTAAITNIRFYIQTGNFAEYSTATLYGIVKS
jgi:hypothetical protein